MFWANFALALAAGFMVSQVATFATTIYLHRCATHNAFELPLWLHRVFRSLIWLTTGQKTKLWVAVHRKHHANSDHDGDPHSPLIFGFMKVQLLNWLLYYRETQNPITIEKYGRGVYEERLDRVLFNRGLLGIGTGI